MAKVTAEKILLGQGVVAIGGTPIGLTRGGSAFNVEREFREIEADGDRGPVKGRIVIDTERAVLNVNSLELFNAEDMTKYYPGTSITPDDETTPTKNTWQSTLEILDTDYQSITWTGKTKDGKAVVITLENAINMGNVEWTLEDKNEVVPELQYTSTYDETTRDTPPWKVDFDV